MGRKRIAVGCLSLAVLLIAAAVVSLWFPFGYNDTAFVAAGTLRVQQDIFSPASFGIWEMNPLVTWPRRLRSLVAMPEITPRYIACPCWVVILPLIVAAWWTWARTHQPGCCPKCGYDLRASPERCPECGQASAAQIQNPAR